MRLRTCTDDRARCELHVKQRRNGRLQVPQTAEESASAVFMSHAGFEGRDGIRVPDGQDHRVFVPRFQEIANVKRALRPVSKEPCSCRGNFP